MKRFLTPASLKIALFLALNAILVLDCSSGFRAFGYPRVGTAWWGTEGWRSNTPLNNWLFGRSKDCGQQNLEYAKAHGLYRPGEDSVPDYVCSVDLDGELAWFTSIHNLAYLVLYASIAGLVRIQFKAKIAPLGAREPQPVIADTTPGSVKRSISKAIVAGFLIAIATSMVVHLYYQFCIYHRHDGERALALYGATGKVDGSTFSAFGYTGWITTIKDDFGNEAVVNVDVRDGKITFVTFSVSYLSRMVVIWNGIAWLVFGIAFAITVPLALAPASGAHTVFVCGWLLVGFGGIILAGAFVLKKYLGLNGLDDLGSIQFANVVAGLAIAEIGFWLTRKPSTRTLATEA